MKEELVLTERQHQLGDDGPVGCGSDRPVFVWHIFSHACYESYVCELSCYG
jgi:hypothetical protein